jgi:hypothetical protein
MNANDIFDNLMGRVKHIREFTVVAVVPEDFCFNGTVPYDLTIKDNIMTAKVWAITHEEAAEKLSEYIRLGY